MSVIVFLAISQKISRDFPIFTPEARAGHQSPEVSFYFS